MYTLYVIVRSFGNFGVAIELLAIFVRNIMGKRKVFDFLLVGGGGPFVPVGYTWCGQRGTVTMHRVMGRPGVVERLLKFKKADGALAAAAAVAAGQPLCNICYSGSKLYDSSSVLLVTFRPFSGRSPAGKAAAAVVIGGSGRTSVSVVTGRGSRGRCR